MAAGSILAELAGALTMELAGMDERDEWIDARSGSRCDMVPRLLLWIVL